MWENQSYLVAERFLADPHDQVDHSSHTIDALCDQWL